MVLMKTFGIDDFTISIDDALYNKALEYYVLEKGDDEEERRGNYLYLKNAIRAGSCKDLKELGEFSYEKLRKAKTDEEISAVVKKIIIRSLRDYGCDI